MTNLTVFLGPVSTAPLIGDITQGAPFFGDRPFQKYVDNFFRFAMRQLEIGGVTVAPSYTATQAVFYLVYPSYLVFLRNLSVTQQSLKELQGQDNRRGCYKIR